MLLKEANNRPLSLILGNLIPFVLCDLVSEYSGFKLSTGAL